MIDNNPAYSHRTRTNKMTDISPATIKQHIDVEPSHTLETQRYMRKSFSVDAIQVTSENMAEVAKWCGGNVRTQTVGEKTEQYVKVRVYHPTNERQTKAFIGDWILYAGTGYKVYTQRAFEKNFEAAI